MSLLRKYSLIFLSLQSALLVSACNGGSSKSASDSKASVAQSELATRHRQIAEALSSTCGYDITFEDESLAQIIPGYEIKNVPACDWKGRNFEALSNQVQADIQCDGEKDCVEYVDAIIDLYRSLQTEPKVDDICCFDPYELARACSTVVHGSDLPTTEEWRDCSTRSEEVLAAYESEANLLCNCPGGGGSAYPKGETCECLDPSKPYIELVQEEATFAFDSEDFINGSGIPAGASIQPLEVDGFWPPRVQNEPWSDTFESIDSYRGLVRVQLEDNGDGTFGAGAILIRQEVFGRIVLGADVYDPGVFAFDFCYRVDDADDLQFGADPQLLSKEFTPASVFHEFGAVTEPMQYCIPSPQVDSPGESSLYPQISHRTGRPNSFLSTAMFDANQASFAMGALPALWIPSIYVRSGSDDEDFQNQLLNGLMSPHDFTGFVYSRP